MEKDESIGELVGSVLKELNDKLNQIIEQVNFNTKTIKRLYEILAGKK